MRSSKQLEINSIYNYHRWRPDLASAGQPDAEELEGLAGVGFEWIINISAPKSDGALDDEAKLVTAMGLRYSHIPVLFEAPSDADFERFCDIMDASKNHKRFVHCDSNYGASVLLALYLHFFENLDYENVMNQVYDIWQPNSVWQKFICRMLEQYALAEVG